MMFLTKIGLTKRPISAWMPHLSQSVGFPVEDFKLLTYLLCSTRILMVLVFIRVRDLAQLQATHAKINLLLTFHIQRLVLIKCRFTFTQEFRMTLFQMCGWEIHQTGLTGMELISPIITLMISCICFPTVSLRAFTTDHIHVHLKTRQLVRWQTVGTIPQKDL